MSENIDLTTIGTDEYIRWVQEDRKRLESEGLTLLDDRISDINGSMICMFCIHFNRNIWLNSNQHKCTAFYDIPLIIWNNEFDHNNPYQNDNGIQFSRIPETGN